MWKFSSWKSDFFLKKEKRGRFDGKTGMEETVQVAGTGVSSVLGHSGERSGAGGMFTNN